MRAAGEADTKLEELLPEERILIGGEYFIVWEKHKNLITEAKRFFNENPPLKSYIIYLTSNGKGAAQAGFKYEIVVSEDFSFDALKELACDEVAVGSARYDDNNPLKYLDFYAKNRFRIRVELHEESIEIHSPKFLIHESERWKHRLDGLTEGLGKVLGF